MQTCLLDAQFSWFWVPTWISPVLPELFSSGTVCALLSCLSLLSFCNLTYSLLCNSLANSCKNFRVDFRHSMLRLHLTYSCTTYKDIFNKNTNNPKGAKMLPASQHGMQNIHWLGYKHYYYSKIIHLYIYYNKTFMNLPYLGILRPFFYHLQLDGLALTAICK